MTLEEQIAREARELADADRVPILPPPAGRCSWCGQLAQEVEYVDSLHGVERYRGVECCGRRPR